MSNCFPVTLLSKVILLSLRLAWEAFRNQEFLTEKSHGQSNLEGYSPWGHKESDSTKQLSTRT